MKNSFKRSWCLFFLNKSQLPGSCDFGVGAVTSYMGAATFLPGAAIPDPGTAIFTREVSFLTREVCLSVWDLSFLSREV
ncbi:MAG: hypothetical protein JXQ90_03740 [Cyclobacteriaceae bacterium]